MSLMKCMDVTSSAACEDAFYGAKLNTRFQSLSMSEVQNIQLITCMPMDVRWHEEKHASRLRIAGPYGKLK